MGYGEQDCCGVGVAQQSSGRVGAAGPVVPGDRGGGAVGEDRAALAADGVAEFLFVGVPMKIRGATGAPIRPLALVER